MLLLLFENKPSAWASMIGTLWLALLLDVLLGELPSRVHPVAWLGSVIGLFYRQAPKAGRLLPFVAGLMFSVIGMAVVVVIGFGCQRGCSLLPQSLSVLLQACLLKLALSLRGLLAAGREVEAALRIPNLAEARRLVSWHLVSRDTSQLNESQVTAATIESLAENTSDSVVAPLFWFTLFGLPGAFACRFINTCDAMLGYRDPPREWLGKFPARLDDVVHLLPARLTALAMLSAGLWLSRNTVLAVSIWWRDCRKTASPNAGHPMSAAAGVLGVELEKVGCYRLGLGQRPPCVDDILRAGWLVICACALSVGILSLGIVCWESWR